MQSNLKWIEPEQEQRENKEKKALTFFSVSSFNELVAVSLLAFYIRFVIKLCAFSFMGIPQQRSKQ